MVISRQSDNTFVAFLKEFMVGGGIPQCIRGYTPDGFLGNNIPRMPGRFHGEFSDQVPECIQDKLLEELFWKHLKNFLENNLQVFLEKFMGTEFLKEILENSWRTFLNYSFQRNSWSNPWKTS